MSTKNKSKFKKVTIEEYVRHIRDKYFGGYGKAIYINDRDQIESFALEMCPEELKYCPLPPVDQMVFPVAIVYDEEKACWVDAEGNYWSVEAGTWSIVEGGGFL